MPSRHPEIQGQKQDLIHRTTWLQASFPAWRSAGKTRTTSLEIRKGSSRLPTPRQTIKHPSPRLERTEEWGNGKKGLEEGTQPFRSLKRSWRIRQELNLEPSDP